MKANLTINGKEFEVEISEEQAQALTAEEKKTGYERVEVCDDFYYVSSDGSVDDATNEGDDYSENLYSVANYYSNRTVAENNARADKLYRQLRRFAVEHREKEIAFPCSEDVYSIAYNYQVETVGVVPYTYRKGYGMILFDLEESARLAIDTFKDELIWYFTEYKDSL